MTDHFDEAREDYRRAMERWASKAEVVRAAEGAISRGAPVQETLAGFTDEMQSARDEMELCLKIMDHESALLVTR